MAAVATASDRILHLDSMRAPKVAIIVPTFNERDNIRTFVAAVASALRGVEWEMVVVDDDSPDGTYQEILNVARINPRVRGLLRIGRRGLSSAVIEGILASSAPIVAVMDADMQHDERILPEMLARIERGADLVIGTRYDGEGGIGSWDAKRAWMSEFATKVSRVLVGDKTSDPMSGFFMASRSVLSNSIYDLSQQGYKILLDVISSAPNSLKIDEVPYTFREREAGESKLSFMVIAEFLFLIIEKLTGGLIPPRFLLFALVGGLGVLIHLTVLNLMGGLTSNFVPAQIAATISAMVFNFFLNNEFTFRDRRLVGRDRLIGLALFILTCSLGALANVSVADLAQKQIGSWNIAGLIGALMGAVFNFGLASNLVWNRKKRRVRTLTS